MSLYVGFYFHLHTSCVLFFWLLPLFSFSLVEMCDRFILDLGNTTEFVPLLPRATELLFTPVLMIHLVRSVSSIKDSVSSIHGMSASGGMIKGYVALERAALNAAWEELPSTSLDAPSYPEIASHVRDGTIILFDAVRSSFTRCQTLTGGLFMPSLMNATEELALNFVFKFSSLVVVIRKRAGLDTLQTATIKSNDNSDQSTWCSVEGSFQLLVASRRLQQTMYDLDTELHAWVKQVIVRWQQRERGDILVHHQHYQQQRNSYGSSSSSSTSSTPYSCSPSKDSSFHEDIDYLLQGKQRVWEYLIQSDPEANEEMKKQVQRLLHSSRRAAAPHDTEESLDTSLQKTSAHGPWDSVREQVDTCVQKVQKLVFDCLFLPLRQALQGLHSWPRWKQQQEKQNEEDVPLPEFSLQPSAYITQVGDILLTLMEQLEPHISKYEQQASQLKKTTLLEEAAPLEDHHLGSRRNRAKEGKKKVGSGKSNLVGAEGALKQDSSSQFWMSKIVEGLGELLLKEIIDIPRIEDKGSAQLGTDLNYLSNVIQALGVQLNPALEHISKFLVLSTTEIRTRWEQKKLAAGWSKSTLPYLKKLLIIRGIKKAKKRGDGTGQRAPGEAISTGHRKHKIGQFSLPPPSGLPPK